MHIAVAGAAHWIVSPNTWRRPNGSDATQGRWNMPHNRIVSQDEWLAARQQHLSKERDLTRLRVELSRQRRELPWVKIEKPSVFDAPDGKATLGDLFDGRSQLIVKHFMFGPGWKEGCVGCSFEVDHIEGHSCIWGITT